MTTPIIGIDFSLNHFGAMAVDLYTGDVLQAWYTYQTKKYVHTLNEPFPILGFHIHDRYKDESHSHYNVRRWWENLEHLLNCFPMEHSYVAIEDYAYNSKDTNRILQIAELTGIIKNELLNLRCHIRMIEPKSLKMFGAKNGNALKVEMVDAAEDQMGVDFPSKLLRETTEKVRGKKVPELDGPGTDLADAYHLANALRLERLVKTGVLTMDEVDPYIREKLFYRVTKANPVSIMDQDYMERPEDD